MFYENKIGIRGLKDNESILRVLKKYIPVAAVLGGVSIGFISVIADVLGTVIPGSSMFMICGIVFNYYQTLTQKED